ncbi:MAG: alpha-ribazole phosphatase [Gallionella sp.]|jgi:alpha-ribazole phosphatase
MKTLYLIRHTLPDIAPGICYGQLDIDVVDSFEQDAAEVTDWLTPPDLIITSPLLRTRKLAEFLAKTLNCKLRTDLRLMEKHFGAWEGIAWDDIARRQIDAWAMDIMNYQPEGGESAQQLLVRVQALLDDLAKLPQRNIALVAHGGSIRAILALVARIPLADTLNWQIDYGAVITLRI